VLILEIIEDYEDADAEKLSGICSALDATSEEKIRAVADTLWTKKVAQKKVPTKEPSLKPYSGTTVGGTEDLSHLTARQKIERGLKEKAKSK